MKHAAANAAAPPLPTVYSKDLNSEQIEFTIGAGTAAQRTVTIPYSYPRANYRTMVYALVGGRGRWLAAGSIGFRIPYSYPHAKPPHHGVRPGG